MINPPIELREYQTKPDVPLTTEEMTTLKRLVGNKLSIQPGSGGGLYNLTASSYVGNIDLRTSSILIRPKVELDRVLFMLSYAMSPKHWRDWTRPAFGTDPTLVEAIVPSFVAQLETAFRPGILQGYVTKEEALPTVRGRIRIDDLIRNRYGIAPRIDVRYDEFSEDIELNRILRSAIARLGRARLRSRDSKESLRRYAAALGKVALVEYGPRTIPKFQYNRLNERYRGAIELACLILANTSLELRAGRTSASALLVNMNDVFENFVWVALRERLRLSETIFPKNAKGRRIRLDAGRRIKLEPDLSWWENHRCVFVGDVKYKHLEVRGFKHPDIYQMLAYTLATELDTGLLIYAEGETESATHQIEYAGIRIDVVTLDVSGTPEDILAHVSDLADRINESKLQQGHPGSLAG